MKSNVKTKILIALFFLILIAALLAVFFANRRGNGEIRSAYDYTVKTTVSATVKEKKTTKKADSEKADAKKTTEKADAKATTTTTLKKGQKKITVPGTYVTILNKYQDALKARSGEGALLRAGISPLLSKLYEGVPADNVGFYVDDFNGDGTTDLLIGVVNGYDHYPYAILDYYTLDNYGEAYNVFQSEANDYYTACTKARVLEKGSVGKDYTEWYLYGFNSNGMALTFKEGLIRDREANAKKPWFQAEDMDGNVNNDHHVKNDVGTKRQKQLDNARIQLTFTPFSKYKPVTK